MSVKTVESWSAQFLRVDVEMLPGPEAFRVLCLPNILFTSASWTVKSGDREVSAGSIQLIKSAVKVVQLVGKGGITVVDSCNALLVLRDLLQVLSDSSSVAGSELVLKVTLVLKRGLLDRLLHLALNSSEFLPAAADEPR